MFSRLVVNDKIFFSSRNLQMIAIETWRKHIDTLFCLTKICQPHFLKSERILQNFADLENQISQKCELLYDSKH